MEIVKYTKDKLTAATYNPRKISKEDMAQLKKSIREFTLVEPIVVNTFKGREGVIVGGHQRYRAAGRSLFSTKLW